MMSRTVGSSSTTRIRQFEASGMIFTVDLLASSPQPLSRSAFLSLQYRVDGGQQEMRPIRLGRESIDAFQFSLGHFQVVRHHDYRNLRLHPLDFICYVRTVQKAEVIFDNDRIHWPRHQEAQTIVTVDGCDQPVSRFLQKVQLGRIAMYAQ